LPRGVLAAMVVHATGESVHQTHPDGCYAVVLAGVPEQLQDLERRLRAACVSHRTIIEADGPFLGQVLAIGITPASRDLVRPFVSSLPLLK
jgi:hypothetical protein